MNYEQEQQFAAEVKRYVTEHLPLSQISDSELQQQIEDIVEQRIGAGYCSIEQRVSIVEQVYSSIRGFGLLDSIIKDDTITEVMINGPENVFIEQNGRLFKLDKQFESQRKLEDIIQRIVGLAGREVNQANPICDTRLPDGSRVNVVLPPIALCGPTVTIRKFSKTPMTIAKGTEHRPRRLTLHRPCKLHRGYAEPLGDHGPSGCGRPSAGGHPPADRIGGRYHYTSFQAA